jgi:hypothetical protein
VRQGISVQSEHRGDLMREDVVERQANDHG